MMLIESPFHILHGILLLLTDIQHVKLAFSGRMGDGKYLRYECRPKPSDSCFAHEETLHSCNKFL